MRIISCAILLTLFSQLNGCGRDRDRDMSACHFEAVKSYPNEVRTDLGSRFSLGQYSDKIDTYAQLCMKAKGYDLLKDIRNTNCGDQGDLYLDENCYRAIR